MSEWIELDLAGFCAVCLDELEAGRDVRYCGQKCRGILRAWEKADAIEDGVAAYFKRAELRTALEDRRAPIAAKAGLTLEELYVDRCERSNGLAPGTVSKMLAAPSARA